MLLKVEIRQYNRGGKVVNDDVPWQYHLIR